MDLSRCQKSIAFVSDLAEALAFLGIFDTTPGEVLNAAKDTPISFGDMTQIANSAYQKDLYLSIMMLWISKKNTAIESIE